VDAAPLTAFAELFGELRDFGHYKLAPPSVRLERWTWPNWSAWYGGRWPTPR
jgi:hypothetical protein